MFIDQETIATLERKYKKNTIKTINNSIKKIFVKGLNLSIYDSDKLIDKADDIIKYINSLDKIGVKKTITFNIIAIIGKNNKKYNNLSNGFCKENNRIKLYKKPTKKEINLYKNLEEINNIHISYTTDNYYNFIRYVISAFYVYLPPLRGQEFYTLKISDTELDTNYYNTKTNTININNYKTMDKYGPKQMNIDSELKDILTEWIDFNDIKNGDYLLTNSKKNKFTQYSFTKMLWRIFGKGFSVDMLRKVYIVEILRYLNGKEILWRKRLSFIMGHSIITQEFIYSNFRQIDNINYSSNDYMNNVFNRLKNSFIGI